MPSLSDFGIVSIATALTRRFKLRKEVTMAEPALTSAGLFSKAGTYGGDYVFEAEGNGDLPADFAVAGAGANITGLSGGTTLVLSAGEKQGVGRHNEWSASGEHAPDTE